MTDSQKWLILSGLAGAGILLYLLAPVLTPFLVAALLAYMGDPLTDRLEKRLPRSLSVLIVFALITLVFALLLLILAPMAERQLSAFFAKLPGYIDRVQHDLVPWLQQTLGVQGLVIDLDSLKNTIAEEWKGAGGVAAGLLASISRSGLALIGWLVNLLLIPVLTFYLLRDWDTLVARVHELIPRRFEATVARLARDSDEVLGAFLRGQLMVMLGLATIYSIGLWLAGLDFALLIGGLAGLVSFVPYLGFFVGIVVAGAAAMLQFQEVSQLLPVAVVFAIGQGVEGMVLTPVLVGDRIGLHPVAVIFAVLAGGQLFGFFGILLALPVAAVVMVILRHAHETYKKSSLYAP